MLEVNRPHGVSVDIVTGNMDNWLKVAAPGPVLVIQMKSVALPGSTVYGAQGLVRWRAEWKRTSDQTVSDKI